MKSNHLFLVLFIGIIFSSCSSDNFNQKLQGEWQILTATRNGRQTSTLEKTYFKFWNGDSLQTNILGSELKTSYSTDKNIVSPDNILTQITVTNNENEKSIFEFNIQNYHFQLTMVKTSNEKN